MMSEYRASRELMNWAEQAGFVFEPAGENQAALFYNLGGEDRLYIRVVEDFDGYRVTSASRGGDEQFQFDAYEPRVAEAYFWMFFGPSVRSKLDLPRLRYPVKRTDVANGYNVDGPTEGRLFLLDASNTRLMATYDDVSDLAHLVKTSHGIAASAAEIVESFMDVSGRPMFEPR
jgi:hypothetical protein